MTFRTSTLIIFALFLGVGLQAQTTGTNPQNSLLPEINPQDIEIRSEFKARFPGLRRQPILGFNPEPRVFRIDPNRIPFMETRDEAVVNIAIVQLDKPLSPKKSILNIPKRTSAYVKAGVGNYITPEVEGYFSHQLNTKSMVFGDVDFRSSDGHLDDELSSFRYFDGNLAFSTKLDGKRRLNAGISFLNDFNRLFNLENNPQNLIGETAKKEYLGFGGNISIQSITNSLEGWEVHSSFNVFAVDVLAGSSTSNGEVNEQVFTSNFVKQWAGKNLYETYKVKATLNAGSYQYTGISSQPWILTKAGIEYGKLIDFNTHIQINASVAYVSEGVSNKLYFAPFVELSYNLKNAVVIKGKAFGTPELSSVLEHHQKNRFLNFSTELQHSYKSGIYGEIAFQAFEGNRVFTGLSYDLIKNYAFYERRQETWAGTDFLGFYDFNFAKAHILELFGGITQQLVPDKFWFDARFYARRPKLSGAGDIPFEERLGVIGAFSYKPIPQMKVSGWAEYIGKRNDPAYAEDFSAFALINGEVEYQISNRFGVYVKVLNILGQNYEQWQGYQERPFQAFGGLTVTF